MSWVCDSEVEQVSSMSEALGSIPSTAKEILPLVSWGLLVSRVVAPYPRGVTSKIPTEYLIYKLDMVRY
jgi:hypothetical protein